MEYGTATPKNVIVTHEMEQTFFLSEILLTSEARMVTYVSKQNVRSEHSLEEVLQTGWFCNFHLFFNLHFRV